MLFRGQDKEFDLVAAVLALDRVVTVLVHGPALHYGLLGHQQRWPCE